MTRELILVSWSVVVLAHLILASTSSTTQTVLSMSINFASLTRTYSLAGTLIAALLMLLALLRFSDMTLLVHMRT